MDPFQQMLVNNLTYLLPTFLGIFLVAFWQKGYFMPYVKVRLSRGKLTLAKVINVDRIIYHPASIDKGNLTWGKEGTKEHLVVLSNMDRDYLYKEQNVECVNIDGATMSFLPPDLSSRNLQLIKEIQKDNRLTKNDVEKIYNNLHTAIEGFDTENVDSLIVNAKLKPSILDSKMKLLIIVVLGVGVIAGIAGYFAYNNGQILNKGFQPDIQTLKAGVEALKTICARDASVIATG